MDDEKYIIADIMTKEMVKTPQSARAKDASMLMDKHQVSSLVVVEKENVVGIVTDKDFAQVGATIKEMGKVKISEMMSTDLIVVSPSLSLREAAEITREHNIRHLLVKSQDNFVGIVSVKDILSTLYEEIKDQNQRLKRKIEELEKFYKVAVDRELIMVKLKKRIRELESEVGSTTNLSTYIME